MSANETLLVFTTWPDAEKAREIGRVLISERLAACVNIFSAPVESIYSWQGKMETASETFALFKTTRATYPKFEARLRSLHPYEVPEIVAVPLAAGLAAYLQWVAANCVSDDGGAQARG